MLFFQFCIPYPGPVFCLLLGVSSGCARPITGQVTSSQNVENSPHYSPWRIMRRILCIMAGMRRIGNAEMFSALSPCYGWNADIMQRFLCIPVRILPSAFSPHFFHIRMRRFFRVPVWILPSTFPPHFFLHSFPYKNAEFSPRSCPNTPICIFSVRKMRRSGVRALNTVVILTTIWYISSFLLISFYTLYQTEIMLITLNYWVLWIILV